MKIVIETNEKEVIAFMLDDDYIMKSQRSVQIEPNNDIEHDIRLAFERLYNPEASGLLSASIDEKSIDLVCSHLTTLDLMHVFACIADSLVEEHHVEPKMLLELLYDVLVERNQND